LHPYSATSVAERARGDNGAFLHTAGWNRLGLIFADGVSKQEDLLISTLETILEGVPIFGGSAGDGLQFEQTFVLCNGKAHKNAAVLLLIETDLAFEGLGFDHFQPVGNPLVITAADPDARVVYEINGSPAAVEYARLVGCDVDQLSPEVFAANPLLLEHHQRHYARAISDAAPDHALSFLAAIDDGLVLKLGRGTEVIDTLRNGLDFSDAHDGRPDFVLGFDCVLRLLEFQQKKLSAVVSETLAAARVFGFNTYGEQHVGLHMNHTFVGVAFYPPGRGTELQ
ncbi:MAG: FIST N-terminal domain-containing protein, partial [Pseudomonadota bacterium]